MSNLIPSDHEAQAHGLPPKKHIVAHYIVVEGFYLSAEIDPHNGHTEKKRVAYSESFRLEPRAKALHAQGALSHILGDDALARRLTEKDKNFRAIATHTIARHENVLVDAPSDSPDEEGLDDQQES